MQKARGPEAKLYFRSSTYQDIGGRQEQQDRFSVSRTSAGVFDGHGKAGAKVSTAAASVFSAYSSAVVVGGGGGEEINELFAQMEKSCLAAQASPLDGGTTAVCVFLSGDSLYVANLGDSGALVFGAHSSSAFATRRHDVQDLEEKQRMLAAGANICGDRVCIALGQREISTAMTRALGYGGAGGMSALPTIHKLPAKRGDIVVLASDGLWDSVRKREALEHISKVDQSIRVMRDFDWSLFVTRRLVDMLTERRVAEERRNDSRIMWDNCTIVTLEILEIE